MSQMFPSRRHVFVTLLALIASVALAAPARAQSPNKKGLAGAWIETVTFAPETGRPPLTSLSTFHIDGTMVCSDQGAITLEPASVFTSCHGVWTHVRRRTFAYTSRELVSDLSGNLFAHLKVSGVYTVSESGNAYAGRSFAELVDVAGNILFSGEVANQGERIQLELP